MKQVLLPILVVLIGCGIAAGLIATGPELEPQPAAFVAPLVRVVEVQPRTVQLTVSTYGTVAPRTESELVPEVDGRVVELSPALVSGGFFRAGEMLLRIEAIDYEVALEQARAGLARAESDLDNARRTHQRQQDLIDRGATSDAQRDDALNRLRIAQATLREARARLSRADRDLERTTLVAPYDGRVRSERVDVGQFVKRGTAVATIYAVDIAEVRLPVQDDELAYLRLPLSQPDAEQPRFSAPVTLMAHFAGAQYSWQGTVVRTEGELDPGTRMVHVVAQVANPYAPGDDRPPLSVGLFVDAEIEGATVTDLVILPRSAMRGADRVLVVDDDDRLRFRDVDVLRRARDQVFIRGGLERGEWVCISPLQSTADGMRVRVVDEPAPVMAGAPAVAPGS